MRAALPASFDLSANCSAVKDQGSTGACTAFSGVGCVEFLQTKYEASPELFSELFVYWYSRELDGAAPTDDAGSYLRSACSVLRNRGVCLSATFPYGAGDYKVQPSGGADTEAATYKVLSYARYEDGTTLSERTALIETLKAGLASGYPIMVGFLCFENLYDDVNGAIPLPSGSIIGGHAVVLVGYDDVQQRFKFKNSWSTSWGDNGYGYLPYYFYLHGLMWDCWSVFTQKDGASGIVGATVVSPGVSIGTLKTQAADLFTALATDINTVYDPIGYAAYFTGLLEANTANPRLTAMIQVVRAQVKASLALTLSAPAPPSSGAMRLNEHLATQGDAKAADQYHQQLAAVERHKASQRSTVSVAQQQKAKAAAAAAKERAEMRSHLAGPTRRKQ